MLPHLQKIPDLRLLRLEYMFSTCHPGKGLLGCFLHSSLSLIATKNRRPVSLWKKKKCSLHSCFLASPALCYPPNVIWSLALRQLEMESLGRAGAGESRNGKAQTGGPSRARGIPGGMADAKGAVRGCAASITRRHFTLPDQCLPRAPAFPQAIRHPWLFSLISPEQAICKQAQSPLPSHHDVWSSKPCVLLRLGTGAWGLVMRAHGDGGSCRSWGCVMCELTGCSSQLVFSFLQSVQSEVTSIPNLQSLLTFPPSHGNMLICKSSLRTYTVNQGV